MYVSLMEQPTWRWICFEFCVRFTAYFDQNISVTCCIKALSPLGFVALIQPLDSLKPS